MSRFRLVLLGALSLFAVLAASAASAVADPEVLQTELCTTGTFSVLCIVLASEPGVLWAQEQAGTWSFVDHIKPGSTSHLNVSGGPTIVCKAAPSTFELDTTATLSLSLAVLGVNIEFKECKVTNTKETEENCVVEEPIVTKAEGSVDVPEDDVVFKQIGTAPFTEITIKSVSKEKTCLFAKAKQKVTGEQLCELLLPEAEEDKEFHLIDCQEGGSILKYAEKEAKFFLEDEVGLAKGGEWDLSTGP